MIPAKDVPMAAMRTSASGSSDASAQSLDVIPGAKSTAGDRSSMWLQFGGASVGPAPNNKSRTLRSSDAKFDVGSTAAAILFAGRLKGKTIKQLKELKQDLDGDVAKVRGNVRQLERAVDERERDKQAKHAELSKQSGGAVLQWLQLKSEADYPSKYDAAIEKARDELHDSLGRVGELEMKLANVQEALETAESAAQARHVGPLFVHFIPPPMRQPGKADLPWIVHTSDGSGCREARHVFFHSLSGFETFEGAPPEQADGKACNCAIANHHLRGFGTVRWDGHDAIIENETMGSRGSGGERTLVNDHAYRELARRQGGHLLQAREEIRRLRAMRSDLFKNRDEERQELLELKSALSSLQEQYKALSYQHEILKVQHKVQAEEWAKAFGEACRPLDLKRVPTDLGQGTPVT